MDTTKGNTGDLEITAQIKNLLGKGDRKTAAALYAQLVKRYSLYVIDFANRLVCNRAGDEERIQQLEAAIDLIPPDEQTLLHLYYYEDKPIKEIRVQIIFQYSIDKRDDADMRNRIETFRRESGTTCGLIPTWITSYGLKDNAYSDEIQYQATLDDLFEK